MHINILIILLAIFSTFAAYAQNEEIEVQPDGLPTDTDMPPAALKENESAVDDESIPEEVALDSWIKKTPRVDSKKEEVIQEGTEGSDAIDQTAAIEEEKRIYKELVSTYKEKPKNYDAIQRVFQKTALSKSDQERITKLKATQRSVRKNMYKKYSEFSPTATSVEDPLRACTMAYEVMTSPSEIKRFKQIMGKTVSQVWKNSILKMGDVGCDFVVVTGVVAKTSIKTEEFLAKTMLAFSVLLGQEWKYTLLSKGRVNSIVLLYRPERLDILSVKILQEVSLRRGEQFVEQEFPMPPAEVSLKQKSTNTPFKIIANDYVFEESLTKPIKAPHMLQISSALRELIELRATQEPSMPLFLAVNYRANPTHPLYHVLVNNLTLENFLSTGSCKIIETEETVKKSKSKIRRIHHECDEERLRPTRRVLFHSFVDMYRLSAKSSQKSIARLRTQKSNVSHGFFVLQKDIAFVYSKDKENKPRAGVVQLGTKDLRASLQWTDFYFDTKR